MTPEQIKRLSDAHLGHKLSDETKAKMLGRTPWNKGKSPSEETRKKLSDALKGRKMPYVAEANKNRIYSEETKKKRVLVAKKNWENPDYIAIMKRPPSFETRLKISLALRGDKSFLSKQDRTQLVQSEKKHLDGKYKGWMLSVKKRDNWKCRICNQDCSGRLEAHHILNWMDYPELRYDINNGITLCQTHHPRGRVKEKQLIPTFQELVLVSS